MDGPPLEILTPADYEMLRRADRNQNGAIEGIEARLFERDQPESVAKAEYAPRDELVANLRELARTNYAPVQISFSNRPVAHVDTGIRAILLQSMADKAAPLGSAGQLYANSRGEVAGGMDCGGAVAVFSDQRRRALVLGAEPRLTHAEFDARSHDVVRYTNGNGLAASALAVEMNDRHNVISDSSGQVQQRFDFQSVYHLASQDPMALIAEGLGLDPDTLAPRPGPLTDPAGVQVSLASGDIGHWVTVTAISDGQVHFYDPGEIDGIDHMKSLPLAEFSTQIKRWGDEDALSPLSIGIVSGTRQGVHPPKTAIGSLDVTGSNPTLSITSVHQVYRSQAEAEARARAVAAAGDEDAVVMREKDGTFAVYGISEVRDLFSGYGSANTLTDLHADIVSVQITDPRDDVSVRPARSGQTH